MVRALYRVAEIIGSGLSRVELDASVTPRRLAELARYGMGADVAQLKRHGDAWRMATLIATAAQLEATTTMTRWSSVNSALPPPEALPEPDWRAELAKKARAVAGCAP